MYLKVTRQGEPVQVLPLTEGSHVVGTQDGADVRLEHRDLSLKQAIIHVEGGRATASSVEGTPGLRFRGARVAALELSEGVEFRVGPFLVTLTHEAAARPAAVNGNGAGHSNGASDREDDAPLSSISTPASPSPEGASVDTPSPDSSPAEEVFAFAAPDAEDAEEAMDDLGSYLNVELEQHAKDDDRFLVILFDNDSRYSSD